MVTRDNKSNKDNINIDDLHALRKLAQNNKPCQANSTAFGRYQLLSELGRGGMGVVYKAYDAKLKSIVALKVIISAEKEHIERFFLETSVIAKLNHPNIVRFYECGNHPQPYFTMEYIEGITLCHLIKEKKVKLLQLIDVIIPLCNALHFAHKSKIMHRDIKPSNIMIAKDGIPKIMDFGLAKVTDATKQLSKSGQVMGTIFYMAPEQLKGKATYQSDIYSFGTTVYEALTYRTVFQGETDINIICQIMEDHPIPLRQLNPDISPYLEAICLKCIHKNPQKRYSSFQELERELKNFKAQRPILAKKYTVLDVFKNFTSKHKVLFTSICLIFVILSISLGITLNTLNYAQNQRNKANEVLEAKEQTNKKLIIEKHKADQVNSDLTALNKAIIECLEFARVVDNYKYNELFYDREFLLPVREVFEQSIRLQTAKEYTFLRGLILGQSQKKKNIAQAIADYTAEIKKNPKNSAAYMNRAFLYQKQRQYDLAEIDYNTSIYLEPKRTEVYINRGVLYKKRGKYHLAERDYNKAVELAPKDAKIYNNRGNVYVELGKLHLAEQDYNQAIRLKPKYANAYVNRGILYEKQNKQKLAENDYTKAIELDFEYADAYNNRAFLYHSQGRPKLAQKDFDRAIGINPKYAEAYAGRGLIYAQGKKYEQAIIDWEKAISCGYPKAKLDPMIYKVEQFLKQKQK